MSREDIHKSLLAICRRALERGQMLPRRKVLAEAMGIDEKSLRSALTSLRNTGALTVRGPEVVEVRI